MTISELKSRFKIIDKPKKGGQKIVYRAIASNGERVALKIISNATDPRVIQEIEILKKLKIVNTPRIIESGTVYDEEIDENALYIIEQYIEGISLRDWLNKGNKADLSDALRILNTLLSIEVQLEKCSILHRDINPNNIIIGENGSIYLIDFGLAKIIGGQSITMTAAAHGPFTPGYAPYEQVANNKMQQDVRTDLFQIGVTIYECCAGNNPFVKPNDEILQIVSRTLTHIPTLLALEGDTKGLFAQFINMLMAKNQSQRPNTAEDALRYLNAIRITLETEI